MFTKEGTLLHRYCTKPLNQPMTRRREWTDNHHDQCLIFHPPWHNRSNHARYWWIQFRVECFFWNQRFLES